MSQPLYDARMKLQRAHKHLNELDRKVAAFINREPYPFVRDHEPQKGKYVYRCKLRRGSPRTWGTIIGDIAHSMRSSLDSITWTFTEKPAKSIQFPIYTSIPKGNSLKSFKRAIRGIPDSVQKIIEELQPHHCGELAQKHPLAVLNWLSNTDKHQVIIPFKVVLDDPHVSPPLIAALVVNSDYPEFMVFVDVDSEMEFNPYLTFRIEIEIPAFEPLGGWEYTRLREIHEFISNDVVPRFEGIAPPPQRFLHPPLQQR